MTIVRKATWKNKNKKNEYFEKCNKIQKKWEIEGSKLLSSKLQKKSEISNFRLEDEKNHQNDNIYYQNNENENYEENDSKFTVKNMNFNNENVFGNIDNNKIGKEEFENPYGVYLFKDRKTILNYFPPNFLPPYNTDEKRKIIKKILSKTWDEEKLIWI